MTTIACARRVLLCLLLLAGHAGSLVYANDYHVDASQGNDAWSGLFAEPQPPGCAGAACTDGAWQSLARVNQGGFLPGDRVLFRCGQAWRDTLTVTDSGANANPLIFSAYGTGCASAPPRIAGSDAVQGWTPDATQPNVYVASVAGPVSQVFVDGQYLKLAQYPDSGYLLIDADAGTTLSAGCIAQSTNRPGNCFLQDAALSGLTDLVGAGLHIRTINWRIEDRTVVNFDAPANTLYWDTETSYEIRKDYGYYLDNKRWMLDAPGEWYHDPAQGKLYLWLPDGSDPSTHAVEASVRTRAFDAQNVSDISISNLAFDMAAGDGIYLSAVSNFVFDAVTVSDSGGNGIFMRANSLGVVRNSTVQRSVRDGISVNYSPGVSIIDNQVIDTGTVGSPKNSLSAIGGASADNLTVTGNRITNVGYVGIRYKRNAVIRNNVIRNSCLVLDDCGAIYTWAKTDPQPLYNALIDSNVIVDVIGNTQGRPPAQTLSMGIYLDDLSSGITVTNNTVVNADRGIFLHNSNNDVVRGNTLFANRQYALSMSESLAAGDITANTVDDNTVFPLAYREAMNLRSGFDNNAFASYATNRYSLLHTDRIATETFVPAGGARTTRYDFPAWRGARETTARAIAPFALAQSRFDPADTANRVSNSDFSTGSTGWGFWPSTSTLAPLPGCGWDGACVDFRASTDPVSSLLISNPLNLVQGLSYVVEFAARGETANQSLRVIVRRSEAGNFEVTGLNETVTLDTQWSYHRLTFTATKTLSTARLEFSPLAGEAVAFDDIRLFPVVANDPADDAVIVINENPVTRALDCPDNGTPQVPRCAEYIDVDGAPVNWPVTLAPYASRIVIWAANPFRDSDFDTLADLDDNCPAVANSPQKDIDQDGYGDACDAFPQDPAEWLDTDSDGIGNNADLDDDNDGLLDVDETGTGVYRGPTDTGTDPLRADTDGDGVNDGLEVAAGTNPLDAASMPVLNDGDVNADGQVNAADLVIALRVLTGQRNASALELAHLDVAPLVAGIPAPDGRFDLGDYLVVLRKVVGAVNY